MTPSQWAMLPSPNDSFFPFSLAQVLSWPVRPLLHVQAQLPPCTTLPALRLHLPHSYSAINSYRLSELARLSSDMAPLMLLSPQSAVVTTHRFLSAQPEKQKNRIKALYDSVVCSLLKTPDTHPRSGDLRNRRNSCTQYLSSISH